MIINLINFVKNEIITSIQTNICWQFKFLQLFVVYLFLIFLYFFPIIKKMTMNLTFDALP